MTGAIIVTNPMNFKTLLALSVNPVRRYFLYWLCDVRETHALICAETERKKIKQARADLKEYERRAALARADINLIDRGLR